MHSNQVIPPVDLTLPLNEVALPIPTTPVHFNHLFCPSDIPVKRHLLHIHPQRHPLNLVLSPDNTSLSLKSHEVDYPNFSLCNT